MEQETFEGHWRTFGNAGDPQSGTLTIGDRLKLRLIGGSVSGFDVFMTGSLPRPVTFIGESVNKIITLLGCQYTYGRSNPFSGSVNISEYIPHRALIGDYAPNEEDPKFDHVVFELTQLNNWANRHNLSREVVTDKPRTYSEALVPDAEALLPGAKIRISNYLNERWANHSELHLQSGEQFEIDLDEKLTISEIMGKYIGPLTALITLASGKPSNVTEIWLADTAVTTEAGSPRFLSLRLDWGNRTAQGLDKVPAALMRFRLDTPGVSFQELVEKWFTLYVKIGEDCELLLSLKEQGTIYPWNDLFKVASAAEGIHRKLNPALERASSAHKERIKAIKAAVSPDDLDLVSQALSGSHRPTFRSRLVALCSEVGPDASLIVGDEPDRWAGLIVNHRNDIAHSLGKTIDIVNVDRVVSLAFSVQMILELFLLRRLGFSENYCSDLLKNQPSWQFFMSQLHEYVPELYLAS